MDSPLEDQPISTAAEESLTAPSSRRNSTSNTNENVKLELPQSACYIIFVGGCERFCFFGVRTILLLYFLHFLHLTKDSATISYHLFLFTCHFTPTIGAILSDGCIGRYLTILVDSIIYFIGTLILTITAVPQIGKKYLIGPFFGLLLIAIGTGGIKPCLSTFGADQIPASNPQKLSRYFSYFYISMSIGSLLSMLIAPLLRSNVECFGYNCYTLAFGVPSFAMLIATLFFLIGTPLYKRIPPKDNVVSQLLDIIWRGIRNFIFRSKSEPKEHWLHHADDKHNLEDIEDVRSVVRVGVLFLPFSMYYALSNQQGSRWTYQASLMDGSLGPFGTIQPDQMQAMSCLLILFFLPLFENVIFPIAARFDWFLKPLQRIYFGMFLMVIGFLVAAILQERIETKQQAIPVRRYTNIYNNYNCSVSIHFAEIIEHGQVRQFSCAKLLEEELYIISTCDQNSVLYKLSKTKRCPSILIVSDEANSTNQELTLIPMTNPISRSRGEQGFALLRVFSLDNVNGTVETLPNRHQFEIQGKLQPTDYQSVLETKYRFTYTDVNGSQDTINSVRVTRTAVYTVLLVNTDKNELRAVIFEDVPPFTVHMLWQIIQYMVISIAEIFVCVTGLGFAYSQSPKRYKVIIMSIWFLTSSFGDLIIIVVAKAHLTENEAVEFVLFAILMAFATFIFGVLAINYKETTVNEGVSEDEYLLAE